MERLTINALNEMRVDDEKYTGDIRNYACTKDTRNKGKFYTTNGEDVGKQSMKKEFGHGMQRTSNGAQLKNYAIECSHWTNDEVDEENYDDGRQRIMRHEKRKDTDKGYNVGSESNCSYASGKGYGKSKYRDMSSAAYSSAQNSSRSFRRTGSDEGNGSCCDGDSYTYENYIPTTNHGFNFSYVEDKPVIHSTPRRVTTGSVQKDKQTFHRVVDNSVYQELNMQVDCNRQFRYPAQSNQSAQSVQYVKKVVKSRHLEDSDEGFSSRSETGSSEGVANAVICSSKNQHITGPYKKAVRMPHHLPPQHIIANEYEVENKSIRSSANSDCQTFHSTFRSLKDTLYYTSDQDDNTTYRSTGQPTEYYSAKSSPMRDTRVDRATTASYYGRQMDEQDICFSSRSMASSASGLNSFYTVKSEHTSGTRLADNDVHSMCALKKYNKSNLVPFSGHKQIAKYNNDCETDDFHDSGISSKTSSRSCAASTASGSGTLYTANECATRESYRHARCVERDVNERECADFYQNSNVVASSKYRISESAREIESCSLGSRYTSLNKKMENKMQSDLASVTTETIYYSQDEYEEEEEEYNDDAFVLENEIIHEDDDHLKLENLTLNDKDKKVSGDEKHLKKLQRTENNAYEKWLERKKKQEQTEKKRREKLEKIKREKAEKQKKLSEMLVQQWRDEKAMKTLNVPKVIEIKNNEREKEDERRISEDRERKRQQEMERKKRHDEWVRLKKIEEEKERALKKKLEEELKLQNEQRRQQNVEAYEKWFAESKGKAKPVPLNQGLDTLRGTIAPIFINKNEWLA